MTSSNIKNTSEQVKGQVRPKFDWLALQHALQFYLKEHFCLIPIWWGKKNPSIKEWEPFQSKPPGVKELNSWFHKDNPTNIAVLCGIISGGLTCLDFNTTTGAIEFFGQELWDKLLTSTFIVQTARGHQVYFKAEKNFQNTYGRKDGMERWMEIKGQGTYVVAPPSLHPSGILYKNIGIEAIASPKNLQAVLDDRIARLGIKLTAREKDTTKEKPKREAPEEQTEEDDKLAVEKLLENCAFIQHCKKNAASLSETYWWSEGQILSFFGEPGREKYHELSSPYHTDHSAYTEKETNDKFDEAIKAGIKGIAPHRCDTIQQTHGFDCPENCLARKMKIKSPAGLARVLVKREKSSKYLITKTNAKGEVTSITVDKKLLIEDLKREFTFMSIFGLVRDDILVYQNGVYSFNGEKLIREECETRVPPPFLTTHMCHEVRDRIAGTTFADRERFNTEKYTINLENGLLDVKTRKLIPHTPAFLSTVRIPIIYDPQAKCPKIQEFLGAILRPEDVKVILEFFGYILIPDYSIPVVLILLGEGSNGKTQLLHLLGQFIGRGNYVSVSLQDIENNPFAVANLEGKLVNMQGDLSSQWLSGLGMLKQLSGQDPITANRKYRDPLHFDNVARLVFASNKPPKIEEDTRAVWRRILPIDLPNIFEGEKDIKNYIDTILTPQELSGLLNLALEGLQQLLSKGDFSYQGDYSDRSRQYTIASDPARAFVEERCDVGAEFKILKDELYKAYKVFCDEHRVQLSGDSQFAKELRQVPGLSINDHQYQKDGVRVRWWLRIQLKGERENGGVRAENIPDYPQEKCPTCGGEEFYLTKDGRYLCSHCRPEPKGIDVEV